MERKIRNSAKALIIEEPKLRPWGTKNMSFYDPDHNVIYFRSFNK